MADDGAENYFLQNGLMGLYNELKLKTRKNIEELKENCDCHGGSGGGGSGGGGSTDPDNPIPVENTVTTDDIDNLFP